MKLSKLAKRFLKVSLHNHSCCGAKRTTKRFGVLPYSFQNPRMACASDFHYPAHGVCIDNPWSILGHQQSSRTVFCGFACTPKRQVLFALSPDRYLALRVRVPWHTQDTPHNNNRRKTPPRKLPIRWIMLQHNVRGDEDTRGTLLQFSSWQYACMHANNSLWFLWYLIKTNDTHYLHAQWLKAHQVKWLDHTDLLIMLQLHQFKRQLAAKRNKVNCIRAHSSWVLLVLSKVIAALSWLIYLFFSKVYAVNQLVAITHNYNDTHWLYAIWLEFHHLQL